MNWLHQVGLCCCVALTTWAHIPQGRYSATNSTVTLWQTNAWTYDGLNRVKTETVRDGATTTFGYNALGNLTSRAMPGGITWSAIYTNDGRILGEKDTAGGQDTRVVSYAYYSSGQWAGRLWTVTDGRNVTRTNAYDDWLRLANVSATGPLDEHKMTATWQYDARGLATNITQAFASTDTGPTTVVQRAFDPYSQPLGETITVGGVVHSGSGQAWDAAGRRSVLSVPYHLSPFTYSFGYRADGLMTSAGGATFSYGDNGLLTGRTNLFRSLTVTSRDGTGRRLQTITKVGGSTALTEALSWRGDALPTDYTATRTDFTDTRDYTYASASQRLTQESLCLAASQPLTNSYTYDHGQSAGLGVMTTADQAGPLPATWSVASTNLDSFKRVKGEQNTAIHRTARGMVNGPATLRGNVNGRPLDLQYTPSTGGDWSAEMALSPGTNTLTVYADHPSGQFTTNKTSAFTVSTGALDKVDTQFDGAGNITNRVWRKADGSLVKFQSLTWDSSGRLVKVVERDASTNGFNWHAVFDGLGRRVRTWITPVTNSIALDSRRSTLDSYFDPLVEFLEIGVSVNDLAVFKLYGPDGDGAYGSQQGLGGLEYVGGAGVLQDHFGNILAGVVGSVVTWCSARVNSYAPVEGYAPLSLAPAPLTVEHLAWRGKWRDVTGLYYWGARPYDFARRNFLSFDPFGHSATPDGYAAFSGNPVVYWDADGRLAKAVGREMYYSGSAFISADFWGGMGASAYGIGSRTVEGVVETAAIGSDMLGQSAASLFGYGADYQGYSQLYRSIYLNPSVGPTSREILLGTGETVVNIGTLGLYGIAEGLGEGLATGNYNTLGDASLNSLFLTSFARAQQAKGINPWTGKGPNILGDGMMDSVYYEIGQKTLPRPKYEVFKWIESPIERGRVYQQTYGWPTALFPEASGFWLGFGTTFSTGPTPGGWFGLNVLNIASFSSTFSRQGDE